MSGCDLCGLSSGTYRGASFGKNLVTKNICPDCLAQFEVDRKENRVVLYNFGEHKRHMSPFANPARSITDPEEFKVLELLMGFYALPKYMVPICSRDGGAVCYEDAIRRDVLDDWVKSIVPKLQMKVV